MLNKVLNTFYSNACSIIINLFLVILSTKFLGIENKGMLSIILASSAFVQIINGIVGVGAVFYLLKEFYISELLIASLLWSFLISALGTIVCAVFYLFDFQFIIYFFLISYIVSNYTLITLIILHQDKNKSYNILKVLQPSLLLICIILNHNLAIFEYLGYMIGSYLVCLAFGLFILKDLFVKVHTSRILKLVKESFKYGGINQMANLTQGFNYRFSLFALEKFSGLKSVGIFSVLLSISEVIWLFSGTIGVFMSSFSAKSNSIKNDIFIIKKYIIYSILGTSTIILLIYLIPNNWYVYLLTIEFNRFKFYLSPLLLGLVMFAATKVIANYFAGRGLVLRNLIASFVGLLFCISFGFILIPKYGIIGASFSNSISYVVSTLITIYFFKKIKDE